MISLDRLDDAYVLHLGEDENRFSPAWLQGANAALDKVLEQPAPLVTIATGKFYSNGLDLDWISTHADQLITYTDDVQELLARVLTLPVPTVAAVSGHAFGAGAMLATAHDWRIMRSDRGYFCFPEVDIRIPFTSGMAALIQAKLTPQAAIDSMTTGTRFTASDALATGLINDVAEEADLLNAAIAKIAPLKGKNPDTLAAIKTTMFITATNQLRNHRPG